MEHEIDTIERNQLFSTEYFYDISIYFNRMQKYMEVSDESKPTKEEIEIKLKQLDPEVHDTLKNFLLVQTIKLCKTLSSFIQENNTMDSIKSYYVACFKSNETSNNENKTELQHSFLIKEALQTATPLYYTSQFHSFMQKGTLPSFDDNLDAVFENYQLTELLRPLKKSKANFFEDHLKIMTFIFCLHHDPFFEDFDKESFLKIKIDEIFGQYIKSSYE